MSLKKIGIATVLLGLCIGLAAYVYLRDPISPRNCNRIQLGMTIDEVDTILGRPSPNRKPAVEIPVWFLEPTPDEKPDCEHMWLGEAWLVLVHFDAEGKVCGKGVLERNVRNQQGAAFLEIRQRWGW